TGISPQVVVNDAPRTITVSGSHFAPDALVRVGTLDPLTPTQATASQLQVQLPAAAAAQVSDIIVTNQNTYQPLAEQHQSGILRGKFTIYTSPQYQPAQQVLVTNGGESTVTQLHAGAALPMFQYPNDWLEAIGFSDDANRGYITNNSGAVNVIDIAGNAVLPSIPLPGVPGYGNGIAMAHYPGTGQPVVYVGSDIYHPDQDTFDEQLQIIDADPASPTYNTVMTTIDGGLQIPSWAGTYRGGLAATPDGSYVYYQAVSDTFNLMIFDVANHTSSHIPLDFLGNPDWTTSLHLTEDGRYMVTLADKDKALAVLDLADRWNPQRVATITATPPPGATVGYLCAFDLIGNRLFVVDGDSHVAYAFNFDPANSNYDQLGSFTIPAVQLMSIDTITVSPDGSLLYVPLSDEDGVAVLDTERMVAGAPGVLLTKIRTGVGAYFAGLRPGAPTPAGTQVVVLPMQGVTATFDNVTTAGATTAATTNTHPLATPAGFQVSNPPLFYRLGTTAQVGGNADVCFAYDPAWFKAGSVRVLQEDSGSFVDRTFSLDQANHVVCAKVSSLGSFVLGVAPACVPRSWRPHC
ncbi:MAG: IPT/TIG domain-containing protein, partial [Terriglobales bacterium]